MDEDPHSCFVKALDDKHASALSALLDWCDEHEVSLYLSRGEEIGVVCLQLVSDGYSTTILSLDGLGGRDWWDDGYAVLGRK